jgi:hypothetical protein
VFGDEEAHRRGVEELAALDLRRPWRGEKRPAAAALLTGQLLAEALEATLKSPNHLALGADATRE